MILHLLLASLTATTHMTLLSYFFSETFREHYKQPLLLKHLIKRLGSPLSRSTEAILGWVAHYTIGFLFVLAFELLLHLNLLEVTWRSALVFGTAAALIGIEWWQFMFKLSKFPPIDFKGFYKQLFFVHIIFGLSVVGVYKFLA